MNTKVVEGLSFSRMMFEEFILQDKFMSYRISLKNIDSFDELVPDKRCLIQRRRQTFDDWGLKIKTSDIRLFDKKLKTLRLYMSDKWFRGERDPPRTVIGVVISIAFYPDAKSNDQFNVTRVDNLTMTW